MRRLGTLAVVLLVACGDGNGKKDGNGDGGAGAGGTGGTGGSAGTAGRDGAAGGGGTGGGGTGDGAVDAPAFDAGAGDRPGQTPDMAIIPPLQPSDAMAAAGSPIVVMGSATEIRTYHLDTASGRLIPRGAVTGADVGASYGVFNEGRDIFYAMHRAANPMPADGGLANVGALTAFRLGTDGNLTRIGMPLRLPFDSPTHVGLSKNGRVLFTAFFGARALVSATVGSDNAPAAVADTKTMAGDRPLNEAHQAYVEDKYVYVPCRAGNIVAQFQFGNDGKLSELNPPYVLPRSLDPGAADAGAPDGGSGPTGPGPRHMVIHPNGRFAFLLNELEGQLNVFRYQANNGRLGEIVQVIKTVPDDVPRPEVQSAHPEIHPKDPTLLYVSNRTNPSIDVFKIDTNTGMLTRLQHETAGGMVKFPRDFQIDPDGKFLVMANERPAPDNVALVFEIAGDGKLALKSTIETQANARYVGIVKR